MPSTGDCKIFLQNVAKSTVVTSHMHLRLRRVQVARQHHLFSGFWLVNVIRFSFYGLQYAFWFPFGFCNLQYHLSLHTSHHLPSVTSDFLSPTTSHFTLPTPSACHLTSSPIYHLSLTITFRLTPHTSITSSYFALPTTFRLSPRTSHHLPPVTSHFHLSPSKYHLTPCLSFCQSELAEYVEEQIKESQSKEKLMQLRRKVQGLEASSTMPPVHTLNRSIIIMHGTWAHIGVPIIVFFSFK